MARDPDVPLALALAKWAAPYGGSVERLFAACNLVMERYYEDGELRHLAYPIPRGEILSRTVKGGTFEILRAPAQA